MLQVCMSRVPKYGGLAQEKDYVCTVIVDIT